MNPMISASIMCADIMNLEPHLRDLEKSGCDYIHVDIMMARLFQIIHLVRN